MMGKLRDQKRDWLLALLERHEGQLTRYAARILGDVERARDVVQETFLKLWKLEPHEVESHTQAWLFAVCRNLSIDALRKEQKMVPLLNEDVPDTVERPPALSQLAADGASGLQAALSALPARQQEVIRLKFQDGLSYKDISQVTGLSVSNVGFLIHSGIKTMRAMLKTAPAGQAAATSRKGGVK